MKIKPLKLFLQIVPCLFGIFAGCQQNFLDAVLQQLSPIQMNSAQDNRNVHTYMLPPTTVPGALSINEHPASIIQYTGTKNPDAEEIFKTRAKAPGEFISNAYFIEIHQKPIYFITGLPAYFH